MQDNSDQVQNSLELAKRIKSALSRKQGAKAVFLSTNASGFSIKPSTSNAIMESSCIGIFNRDSSVKSIASNIIDVVNSEEATHCPSKSLLWGGNMGRA